MSYNRQQLVINDFGGVDLSSSPLQVHSSRASFATNLIKDNGVNHKRPGWRQIAKLGGRINGMYHYVNGEHNVLIVYEGTSFRRYEVLSDGSLASWYDNITKPTYAFDLIDNRVQFFLFKERLYIIGCGDFLVYGEFEDGYELKRVSDIAYVPTVIASATGTNTVNDGPAEPGKVLESFNLLTPRRKKRFIGGQPYPEEDVLYPYIISVGEWMKPESIKISYEIYEYGRLVEKKLTVGELVSGDFDYASNGHYLYDESGETVGYIPAPDILYDDDYGGDSHPHNYGSIHFTEDTSPGGGTLYSNITVEYIPYTYDDNSSFITNCRFGTVFGAYGNADRLFLSGNPSMPNADFYSGFEDFTYFAASSQTVMGSDDQAVTGYLRLSDSTLATFKASSYTEPTVYYRTATETVVELENGEKTSDVAFTRWTGGIGEGCISPYCLASLAGDELMLSENGLFGIVQTENVATNDRYFRERDRYINARLSRCNLANATATVYKNRYYLAVDGACYVADPRFKTYLSDDIDGSFNYEWWYWDNIPARVFAIVNGELGFGTDDGRICVFDGEFTDRTYDESASGELTADGAFITYSKDIDCDICDGDRITLGGYAESLYITDHNADSCTFRVSLLRGGTPVGSIVSELFGGSAPSSLKMKVYCTKNVVSRWFTPVFDLGATDIQKTLLSMTVTLDPTIRGRVSFGYETKNAERLLVAGSEKVFDLSSLDLGEFSFDSGFTSSYTVKVKARHFNYIMFKFISDSDTDCAVCNFKATYIYGGRSHGIR